MKTRYIEVFDTTLREGAQTPYVHFTYEEKKLVLHALLELGVDFAEVGYPASSKIEMEEIRQLSQLVKRPILSGLGRCTNKDISICAQSGVEVVDIDLGISDYQLEILHYSLKEAFRKAAEIVQFTKGTRKRVKFADLDVFRTPIKNTLQLYSIVSKAGAEWFTLCDTVGTADPELVTYTIKRLLKSGGCKLSVHFHNDFDMATANCIAAVKTGAEQIEVTANGIGDRAGITPMAPTLVYLHEIVGIQSHVNLTKLLGYSNIISKITKIPNSPLEPIVGTYCFKHTPGIHGAGVIKNPLSFEPLNPLKIGQQRELLLGHYTGRHVVNKICTDIGIHLDKEQLRIVTDQIKLLARKKKKILTSDIFTIINKFHFSKSIK